LSTSTLDYYGGGSGKVSAGFWIDAQNAQRVEATPGDIGALILNKEE
jgi:hypothetical protein